MKAAGFERFHYPRSMLRMRPLPHGEIVVRCTNIEVSQNVIRKSRAIVLTGVNQHGAHSARFELLQNRSDLHEIRARSGDQQNSAGAIHRQSAIIFAVNSSFVASPPPLLARSSARIEKYEVSSSSE